MITVLTVLCTVFSTEKLKFQNFGFLFCNFKYLIYGLKDRVWRFRTSHHLSLLCYMYWDYAFYLRISHYVQQYTYIYIIDTMHTYTYTKYISAMVFNYTWFQYYELRDPWCVKRRAGQLSLSPNVKTGPGVNEPNMNQCNVGMPMTADAPQSSWPGFWLQSWTRTPRITRWPTHYLCL